MASLNLICFVSGVPGFKLFQCTYVVLSHVKHQCVPLSLLMSSSMYIVIHLESKADTMFG